jgi:hypothetical protein
VHFYTIAQSPDLDVQMNQSGRPGVPYETEQVPFAQCGIRVFAQAGGSGLKVAEDQQIVMRRACFAHGMTGDYRRTEQRPYVDELGVAALMLERDLGDRSIPRSA